MSRRWQIGAGWGIAVATAASALAQAADGPSADAAPPAAQVMLSSPAPGTANSATGDIAREIDDPHTGARWLLLRDPSRPGGPGRLVLVQGTGRDAGRGLQPGAAEVPKQLPVIHAGDRLVVEEDTAVASTRLEAVALGPAVIGGGLQVRLKIGGKLLQAIALAPGRAALQSEVRP
jgi:hypothetical protein